MEPFYTVEVDNTLAKRPNDLKVYPFKKKVIGLDHFRLAATTRVSDTGWASSNPQITFTVI